MVKGANGFHWQVDESILVLVIVQNEGKGMSS